MIDIKKELIDFETYCFETGQLQVGELISSTIMHIAELEKAMDGICVAVFDNRGKAITESTLVSVRDAVDKFNLPLNIK
jgi:hypothetical protein